MVKVKNIFFFLVVFLVSFAILVLLVNSYYVSQLINEDFQRTFAVGNLLENSRYAEALQECSQMNTAMGKTVCYGIFVDFKIDKGEQISEEDCAKLVVIDNRLFSEKLAAFFKPQSWDSIKNDIGVIRERCLRLL